MILANTRGRRLKAQVAPLRGDELRIFLKPLVGPAGVRLGATRMNYLSPLRTYANNGQ
jgi:hypothetical protein